MIALSTSGQLPTEARLFKKGVNATEHGDFTYDDKAEKAIMADYRARGVSIMVDLEHSSLDAPGADPSQRDARGWCELEARPDGLYATSIRWTPDGEARLRARTQRYFSPTFLQDEDGRPVKILNIALVAMPSTHAAPALVAASLRRKVHPDLTEAARRVALSEAFGSPASTGGKKKMDKDLISRTLELIQSGDTNGALPMLKEWVAAALAAPTDGDANAQTNAAIDSDDAAGAEGDGAEGVATPPKKVALNASEERAIAATGCTREDFAAVRASMNRPLVRKVRP